jgi:hypothetical protein
MPQNFLSCDRDQPLLLQPDLRDWAGREAALLSEPPRTAASAPARP